MCRKALFFVIEDKKMTPHDVIMGTLRTFAMVFGLLRFGDWVIVEKLKLNRNRTTYALAWALYICILFIAALTTLVLIFVPR